MCRAGGNILYAVTEKDLPVTDIVAMQSAEPVIFGVVKIVWKDGFAGIVDLRPILAKGEMFNFLRINPARFDDLKLEDYGHCIFWLDDDNDEIDFGSDSLRQRAERQTVISLQPTRFWIALTLGSSTKKFTFRMVKA